MLDDIGTYFNEKFDSLGKFLTEFAEQLLKGLLELTDVALNALTVIVLIPMQILLAVVPTELITNTISTITDTDHGLYKLLSTITFLDSVVDINTVLGAFALGITITLGVLVYKMVIKLIPFIG
jgi:hypothetical protein